LGARTETEKTGFFTNKKVQVVAGTTDKLFCEGKRSGFFVEFRDPTEDFGFTSSAVAFPAEAEFIPPRNYFATVQKELKNAKSSIALSLYLFTLRPQQHDSPVLQLAESLRKAHEAGIRVEVWLDQNIQFVEEEGSNIDLAEGKNAAAYAFLKAQGIPVYFDNPATYNHSKVLVIDEETIILGSSNWTNAALTHNEEANALIRSKPIAKEILSQIRSIPKADPLPNVEDTGVDIPAEFLLNRNYLGRMAGGDERTLDTYLYLLREQSLFPENIPFRLGYDPLAESLGILDQENSIRRSQINRILTKLQNRYGLIRFEPSRGTDALITLIPLNAERSARIPLTYWTQGWPQRLQLPGKTFFLMGQYESANSPLRPRWSAARKTMARRYHLRPGTISKGVTELRRHNLVEVDYSPNVPGKGFRRASIYTPNTLYDPAKLDQALKELKDKHGEEKFTRAQAAATLVYEDKDINAIKALISLEDQYGKERIAESLKIIGKKNPDNPYRSIAYLIGIIKNLR